MALPDNGPRDGDFVRYIDELTAHAAARLPTTPVTPAASMNANETTRTTTPRPTPAASSPPAAANPLPLPPAAVSQLATVALFVVGAIATAVGMLADGLGILTAIGAALLVWAARRRNVARRLVA